MKKKILLLYVAYIWILSAPSTAQVTTPANAGAAGDYVGWNALQAFPVKIRHNGAYPIDFYTNNAHWMRLHSSGQLSIAMNLATDPLVGNYAPRLNVGAATNSFSLSGWAAAIKISAGGAIIFDQGSSANYYFMGHPSASPAGHTYYGLISAIDNTVIPQYIYKVHSVQLAAPNDAAQGTHQFGTGIYLWPINDAGNPLSSHYRPLLTQDVPPLYNATTEPDADVWLYNIGLYQSRPFRGTTPVFSLSNTDEGIVLANQDGIFHTKLRFTGITSDVLLGDGTWGNVGNGFGLCSAPSGPPALPGFVGLNLNDKSVYFEDPAAVTNQDNMVAIGHACGTTPLPGKLDVLSNTFTTGLFNYTHNVAGNFTETGTYNVLGGLDDLVGVWANSDVRHLAHDNSTNLGGDFYAINASTNIGVRASVLDPINIGYAFWGRAMNGQIETGVKAEANSTIASFGVDASGINGVNVNYGVFSLVYPPATLAPVLDVALYGIAPHKLATAPNAINIAVYGDILGNGICAACGPPGTGPDLAGYFDGDLATSSGFYVASDAGLKTNIQDLADPMTIINQLHPKTYDFNQQGNVSMYLPSGNQAGLLAQDVYDILPQLTKDCIHPARFDSLGNQTFAPINFKAVNYIGLIPYLIAAIKEQQSQIEALQNAQPQQMHQNPNGDDTGNSIDVTLSSKTIVLNQNVPNPFKEQTTIEYFIPDDAQQVKIIFTDNKGSVLKEVEISEKGKGQLNVYAADLSSGIYTYTIVADGLTIDSKQMVKTK